MVALLGFADPQVDAVEDYCVLLKSALARAGLRMEVRRVPWSEKGWLGGLLWLWRESRAWRGQWVIVQYTALQWSRRGFSIPVLAVFAILGMRGVRRAVVFHDASPHPAGSFLKAVRRRCQILIMRALYRRADRVIATIATSGMPWIIDGPLEKTECIPVGSNLPTEVGRETCERDSSVKTTVAFSLGSGKALEAEIENIAQIMFRVGTDLPNVKLLVVGRNSEQAADPLRRRLAGSNVHLTVRGFLPPEAAAGAIAGADALLFVRGELSSRHGSAIAGIVLGVPVVAYRGLETAAPITDAGVVLVPPGDPDRFAEALTRVLSDEALRAELRQRNFAARDLYFSWDAIARKYIRSLGLAEGT